MRLVVLLAALLMVALPVPRAKAHALEPGYLEINALEDGQWRVTWRKPQVAGQPMKIDAVLPETCDPRRGPAPRFDGRAFVVGWVAKCEEPLSRGAVLIDGLSETATDVLVRYTTVPDAPAQTFRLTPDAPSVVLPEVPTRWGISGSYFALGFDHILGGIDHLLFVLALLLLISNLKRLVWAVTAFTAAHSITLAASALGWFALPMAPVEAVIALSIVFLAVEILNRRDDRDTLMQRAPWIVAFAFGLLHGLGFASALREIGLPHSDIALALLTFNLGVEAGQLAFVAVVVSIGAAIRLVAPQFLEGQMRSGAYGLKVAGYAIGAVASFWTVERVVQIIA